MNRWGVFPALALLFLAGLLLDCGTVSVATNTGGSTSEVVGRVVYSDGIPVQNAIVRLRSAGFVSDTIPASHQQSAGWDAVTDEGGEFTLNIADTGTFRIEVNDLKAHATLLSYTASGVHAGRIRLPDDTLDSTGIIQGTIALSPDVTSRVFVQVVGLDRIAVEDPATGQFEIPDMPAGKFTLKFVTALSMKSPTTLDSVVVASGAVTTIDTVKLAAFGLWKFSRRIYFNTTASGANVAGTVVNFPVLVRLTSGAFAFSQAQSGGEDVRFTKSDGKPLPYEIERWDASQSLAEIWVKIDTVFGNDSSHFVTMYWGASTGSATVSLSNGAAVFDTADGNVGVWHFEPGLADATPNADNGTDSSTADKAGIIGHCRHFDPSQRSFITIPNEARFDLTTRFTLSVWVQVDTFTLGWQTIVAKGDNAYRLHRNGVSNEACFSLTTLDTANFGYNDLGGKKRIDDHSWHLVFGVFDGSMMRLYVDGNLENDSSVAFPCGTNNLNLTIGDNRVRTLLNTPRFFNGDIDEVRVMRTAVNADWIKLCYMNQMESDKLIILK
jgi:hypothetical protein